MLTHTVITSPGTLARLRHHLARLTGAGTFRPQAGPPARAKTPAPGPRPAGGLPPDLETPLRWIVRRALFQAEGASGLTWRIHAVARRVGGPAWDRVLTAPASPAAEALVRRVAYAIGQSLSRRPRA
jgi:hypothetical protein